MLILKCNQLGSQTANSSPNLMSNCSRLFQGEEMHDLVDDCSLDFKMMDEMIILVIFYHLWRKEKTLCKFVKNCI